ncbi:transglutaminase domain-containing protein [Roseateles sp. DC23W]|uniref:Transglutaminase domain-containing protein n=1 Tax=Pelomonas dachongensis TaxID=3299029 RepID=A0ABW7EW37_9BURK
MAVKLSVHHVTEYTYEDSVEWAHHAACLAPQHTPWQHVAGWRLTIDPLPDGWGVDGLELDAAELARHLRRDPWGNRHLTFGHARVHEKLVVDSRFVVELQPRPAPDPNRGPSWEAVAAGLRYRAGRALQEADEFALASAYAAPDATLVVYARRAFSPGRTLAAAGLSLMHQIHADLCYLPHSTTVATRAADALKQRSGVCQDFAHVFIAACRALGLAARYVSGYLLTRPPEGTPKLVGADASHAWVELWCPEQGWLALDPTNAVPADLDHVTLAWGRDYADVAPLRGVLRGGGLATLRVGVTVEPVGDA